MKVHIDRHQCVGSAQCVQNAPAVFDQDAEDGLVLLRDAAPPPGEWMAARKAADLCPARAIRVVET
jgi:ferredoxin